MPLPDQIFGVEYYLLDLKRDQKFLFILLFFCHVWFCFFFLSPRAFFIPKQNKEFQGIYHRDIKLVQLPKEGKYFRFPRKLKITSGLSLAFTGGTAETGKLRCCRETLRLPPSRSTRNKQILQNNEHLYVFLYPNFSCR